MARIRIRMPEDAIPAAPAFIASGPGITVAVLLGGADDPLHLYRLTLDAGATTALDAADADLVVYVWEGEVTAGTTALAAGSSLVVEHGVTLSLNARPMGAILILFREAHRAADARPGGRVHLLRDRDVPRAADLGTGNRMGGGLHADAGCPSCSVWLHENSFNDPAGTLVPIHSHSEDEIIFVTGGALLVGNRRLGPGSALAVAADTKYGFQCAPGGLAFINFRAEHPTATLSDGVTRMDEAAFWRTRLPALGDTRI